MFEDENPGLIFEADDPLNTSNIPLVLTHDGGGTCFSYYCLDPLGRPTYEIHNPHFYSGESWTGGIPEMASHYVELLRKVVPQGKILLGGWSLGGILSLEMARILADDPSYRVIGVVMVDSICPIVFKTKPELVEKRTITFKGQFEPTTAQETRDRVTRCFSEARRSLAMYQLPSWGEDRSNGEPDLQSVSDSSPKVRCPPTILLRAGETVPAEQGEVNLVDVARDDRALGWNDYLDNFFEDIVDIPGHHFNVFAFHSIETITERLVEVCRKLEIQSER